MRSIYSKTLVVVLSLIGWGAVVPAGHAQTETPLILLTNAWRYHDLKVTPPAAWTNLTFTYTADWKHGLAVVGDEGTPMPAPVQSFVASPGAGGPTTIYCRTNFNYPASIGTNGVSLVFSNLIDDGAIYYLNGREIQRIGMAAGAVTYNTFANVTVGDATIYTVFTIPAAGSSIRIGNNVLAVETHNVNATSSDTVFATSLTARQPQRIVITDQPDSVTNAVGTPVTFSVTVTGSDPVYRWYKEGSPVVQSSASTYTINSPTLNSAGNYKVSVSNVLGVVTSAVARLTMIPDTFPPGIVSAVAQALSPSNTIFVTFTESLLSRTATNPACYRLEVAGTTNRVTVSNAAPSQNTVTLTVGGPDWKWGSNYILTVTGVSDTRGNYLNGLSNRVTVAFLRNLFPLDGVSKHFDWISAFYFHPTNLADNWMTWAYNDSDPNIWTPVTGVAFYDGAPPSTMCGSFGSVLGDVADSTSWPQAYYFRTRFVAPPNGGRGSIRLRGSIDDGVIFYLNGTEIYRNNMPAGKVDMFTSALIDGDPVNCINSPDIAVTNFLSGTNLLAAEVHNSSDAASLDLYYGVQIDATISPTALPALQIKRTNSVPPAVIVSWTPTNFPNWVLFGRTNAATGTWTVVATNSPFQTNLTYGPVREYRLGPRP